MVRTNTAGTDQMDDFLIRDFRLCIGGVPGLQQALQMMLQYFLFLMLILAYKNSQGATARKLKALLFILILKIIGGGRADSYDTVKYAAA